MRQLPKIFQARRIERGLNKANLYLLVSKQGNQMLYIHRDQHGNFGLSPQRNGAAKFDIDNAEKLISSVEIKLQLEPIS